MNESARERCSDVAKMNGAATHATFGQCERLAERLTPFLRTIFVVQTKIFYCETRIMRTISFWLQKLSRLSAIFFLLQKSLKMRDFWGKMQECGKIPTGCINIQKHNYIANYISRIY